jgi:hypothetical protein
MVGAHGTVYVIKDVVDTQFQPVSERLASLAQVVGGVDAPDLIGRSVAVVLIVAGTAATG